MNSSGIKKYITGYILGGFVFLILVPFVIYLTSLIAPASLGPNVIAVRFIKYSVATLLAVNGVVFVIWSNLDLFIAGEGGPADFFNKSISPRSKKLVTQGSYRYSRNPMVFGMNALYVAFSIFLNSLSALLFCLIFLTAIILYIKKFEEKRLLKDFGDEYLEYKKKVSMVIPLPFKNNAKNT